MIIVTLATIITIAALYAPQPLLPVLAREFGVSRDAAALLTTVTFVPLSIAPLVYGHVLQAVSPRRMLRVSVLLLAVTEILFARAETFPVLLTLRLFQGLLIPAMLTALMTYVSRVSADAAVQRKMAIYIGATILGGFLGRFFSGAIATLAGWRMTFLVLAISAGACYFLLARLKERDAVTLARPDPRLLLETVRDGFYFRNYALVFAMFFAFAAVMNFVPFRLAEISDGASEFRTGFMYSGYLMGLVASFSAVPIGRFLGGERRTMTLGLSMFVVSILGLGTGDVRVLFAVMFMVCGSMFLVHATASGLVNRHAGRKKGVVNGLYVAFYYGGGALGSSVPGPLYARFGWSWFVAGLVGMAGIALLVSLLDRDNHPAPP